MKDLHGEATQTVGAAPERCLDLLADVQDYPRWYPDVVRRIEVVEREGEQVTRARATLHAAIGPVNRDLDLLLAVTRAAGAVTLTRVPHAGSDRERFVVRWHTTPNGGGTRLALALDASLDLPRLLPTGGLADTLAAGFVQAAARELGRG